MLIVSDQIQIPITEFNFTFARSSGPGGQNVNKVNTKVTMHWSADDSPSMPADVLARLKTRYRRRFNKLGQLVVISQRYRDQGRNVADCLDKLQAMIVEVEPTPTVRKKTKVSRGARRRRLEDKRRQSDKKQSRRPPKFD